MGAIQRTLVAVAALCTAILCVLLLTFRPADGYELLYQAYPTPVWALFAVGLMALVPVFATAPWSERHYWPYALALVVALFLLFNLLPLFRGWALYGRNQADVLAHVGYAKTLVRTGHVQDDNFYPVVHLLLAELSVLGVPYRTLASLIPGVFTSLYVAGIYLLSREVTGHPTTAVVTLAAAIPFVYGKFQHTVSPSILSFMLFPVVLFSILRFRHTRRPSFLVLALAFTGVLVLFHPVTSLYVLVALVVSLVVRLAYRRLPIGPSTGDALAVGPELALFGWVTVAWTAWYLRFPTIRRYVQITLTAAGDQQSSVAKEYGTDQLAASSSLQQIVVGFVNQYGPIFLLSALAALAVLVVLRRAWRAEAELPDVWLSTQFGTGIAISLVTIFTYVVAFDPIRNSRYMVLMATISTGLLLSWLRRASTFGRPRSERVMLFLVVVLLATAVPVSLLNSYQSSHHMTHSEKDGTEWFYEHRNPDVSAVSHSVSYKMEMFTRGTSYEESTFADFSSRAPVPRYFGYRDHGTAGAAMSDNHTSAYVVTKGYDTKYYEVLRPYLRGQHVPYTQSSVRRLANDSTADKLYSNGDYTVWYVVQERSPTSATDAR